MREYERRYSATPRRPPEPKVKRKEMPRSYSTLRVSEDEKLWAAVAHGSVWVTLLGGLLSAGAIVPLSIFIPLVIYFLFRQQVGLRGVSRAASLRLADDRHGRRVPAAVVGGLVWGIGMVIALLAVVILVGFILVPFWGLVGVVLLGTIVDPADCDDVLRDVRRD